MEQMKVLQMTLLESEYKKLRELRGDGTWRDLIVGWINEKMPKM